MSESIGVWLSDVMSADDLARHAAGRSLGVDACQVALGREPAGRPYVVGAPGLHLTISHCRGLAAVAVARHGPVGIDIEQIRPLPAAELARRWFSGPEADWVAAHPDHFLPLWTQKEAVGKALGIGLRQGGLHRSMPLPPAAALTATVAGRPTMAVGGWIQGRVVIGLACDAVGARAAPTAVMVVSEHPW
ncbi:4'-phosphopantetheinyl transferase superfamily protein [Micromonospora sp. KC721]|uniref:4'-phosphopantetheinyl transferase family protein n=1 Tax=Micromonospora sp. KC721 TaxID=2530380 RepID=UPI001A9F676F|nr:4'-phosphopantetheinyl transferase superfamily protein [Micromonospora sp. KC721]